MVKRNVMGGAGYGFNSWLQQRISALLMLAVGIWLVGLLFYIACQSNSSINSWRMIMSMTSTRVVVQLFFIALVIHAWVGVRDIWMDYIKHAGLRLLAHTLTIVWLSANLIYSIHVVWN
jgi:succinate dehydrogenase / fumarate reductase, membrane anchor subunit